MTVYFHLGHLTSICFRGNWDETLLYFVAKCPGMKKILPSVAKLPVFKFHLFKGSVTWKVIMAQGVVLASAAEFCRT